MELIYLWVEDYKNIHHQGFNFSPRFECDYKDGNLSIYDKKKNECENNNYVENFFGKNINITAIVGENGSGKSNILQTLVKAFYTNDMQSFYCIYEDEALLYLRDEHKILSQKIIDKNKLHRVPNKILISAYYNESTNFLTSMGYNSFEYDVTDELFNGHKPTLDYTPNEQELFYQKYGRLPLDFFKDINFNYNFNEFEIYYKYRGGVKFKENIKYQIISDIIKKKMREYYDLKSHTNFAKSIVEKIDEKELKSIIEVDIRNSKDMEKFIKNTNDFFNQNKITLKDIPEQNRILKDLLLKTTIEEINKSFNKFDYENGYEFRLKPKVITELGTFLQERKLLSFLVSNNIFKIELYDKEKPYVTYSKFSSGEKNLIKHLTNISFSVRHLNKPQEYLILLDEIELTLHPLWKKKLINFILQSIEKSFSLKKTKLKIHVIFTTHSPFLLSDIPKENIIFLKKDENGNCKNVSNEIKLETFGANIHTLLTHSFFMQDGLMGEFAKDKINDVINFLNENISSIKTKEEAKNIISIIGEPFLKNKLLEMYSKIFDEDIIDEKIERLKKEIEMLRKTKKC